MEKLDEVSFALEGLIGYNLKRAYVIVQNDYRATFGEEGMSARVFAALSIVVEMPELTQSDLSRRLGIERSGLVAIIDNLEGRGYLRRVAVPGDRRAQALVPTDAGKSAYADTIAKTKEHEAKLLHMLSDEERGQLLALLKKIRVPFESRKS